jgi:hypothetical protein
MAFAAAATRQARAAADLTDLGTSPRLRLYSGTAPANADAALGGAVLLSDHLCAATPGTASGGVLTFGAIGSATAAASGTVSFARLVDNAGTVTKHQFLLSELTVSAGGVITAGQTVTVSLATLTHPAS